MEKRTLKRPSAANIIFVSIVLLLFFITVGVILWTWYSRELSSFHERMLAINLLIVTVELILAMFGSYTLLKEKRGSVFMNISLILTCFRLQIQSYRFVHLIICFGVSFHFGRIGFEWNFIGVALLILYHSILGKNHREVAMIS